MLRVSWCALRYQLIYVKHIANVPVCEGGVSLSHFHEEISRIRESHLCLSYRQEGANSYRRFDGDRGLR